MNRPTQHAETDEPNDASADKEEERRQQATLDQLAQAWKKEAANSRDHIARRSLIFVHAQNIRSPRGLRKRFQRFEPLGFSMT